MSPSTHLTSCTAIRSKLHFANSLATFQWTYTIETPNIPCSKSHVHIHFPLSRSLQRIQPIPWPCVIFHNMLTLYSEELLAPIQLPSWRTIPCWLFKTAYWKYLHLSYISGSHPVHPQTEDAPYCSDRDEFNTQNLSKGTYLFNFCVKRICCFWHIFTFPKSIVLVSIGTFLSNK